MVLPDDSDGKLCKQYNELCKSLNLDRITCADGWKAFREVYEPCSLSENPLHWMGCAIYVACKTSTTPTLSKPSVIIQGNLINLMALLRLIDLSIYEFLTKMNKWVSFTNLPAPVVKVLTQLERDFNVSKILYEKYQPIFKDLFSDVNENSKIFKKDRSKGHFNFSRLFEFTWTLFVYLKSHYPNVSDDLVNSYNLLLACLDYIFVNVLVSGKKDFINPEFPVSQSIKSKYNFTSKLPCILDVLCARHDGTYVDAKKVKEYFWKKDIKVLFERRILRGNVTLLCDILETANIDHNLKNINKKYEEFLLSVGTFDERIFLVQTPDFGSPEKFSNKQASTSENFDLKRKPHYQNRVNGVINPVNFLKQRCFPEEVNVIPSELQNLSTVQIIIGMREAAPGEIYKQIVKNCKTKPKVEELVHDLNKILEYKLILFSKEKPELNCDKDLVKKHCDIVIKLFYKLLDSILLEETKKPNFDSDTLLNQEIIIKTIFACAFEIIVSCCSTAHIFPWILETLDLPSYYFYKIIEVVVRTEDSLNRDVVQHLRRIEETVLDSMAWSRNSPLWNKLLDLGNQVPSCEDVTIMSSSAEQTPPGNVTPEPKADKLSSLAGILTKSPGAPLADKFLTPHKVGNKRPLNESETEFEPPIKIRSELRNDYTMEGNGLHKSLKENKKPCMSGPVALFFRKFYYLASIRMCDMCNQLRLTDIELRKKIWTCFELTIIKHVTIMIDRHLDQLLMCSIYVICKVSGSELLFTELMKCYRNQRQAKSHIYRDVLIQPEISLDDLRENLPSGMHLNKTVERGDIIKFYNVVYIKRVKSLIKKFTNTSQTERIVLSPIPVTITPPNSSRKISEQHNLYLRTLENDIKIKNSPVAVSQLSYKFSQSPAKDLKAINHMVSTSDIIRVGKRLLSDDDNENNSSCSVVTNKLEGLRSDRITVENQER